MGTHLFGSPCIMQESRFVNLQARTVVNKPSQS